MADAAALLHAYLRQRAELGETEIVLDGIVAADLRQCAAPAPREAVAEAAVSRGQVRRPGNAGAAHGAAPPLPTRPSAPSDEVSPTASPAPAASSPPSTPAARGGSPAPGATTEAILALPTLDAVREVALGCPRCRLAETRGHVVFGEGNPNARVVIVGEAPGADEDRTGRPFVGRAGKLLDRLLAAAGLPREEVFICNVLKCRPPSNRNPQADEVEQCAPYLHRQLDLIRPQAIAAFGTFAAQTLLETQTPIGKLRGKVHAFRGIPLVPTYHPAALLRTPSWIRPTWEDLQRVRQVLDES